jgi:hypothetical protein
MKLPVNVWARPSRKFPSEDPILNETTVRPFGAGGVGIITGHPVGLVFAAGVVLIALIALPEARVFFVGSVAVGAVFGFFLWLVHR